MLSEFFADIAAAVSVSPCEIGKAVKRLSASGKYAALDFARLFGISCLDGANVRELWFDCVESSVCAGVLSREERDALTSFGDALGKSTPDIFRSRCEQLSRRFAGMYEKEKEKTEKNGVLSASLSLLAGAAVIILLI